MAFKASNLTRVPLRKNPNYQRNGLKSYAYLLQKFNIGPTIDGPFHMVNRMEQSGQQAISKKLGKKIGGKAYIGGQSLVKTDPSGNTGEVSAQDIQNDSQYLAKVQMGTPAQTLNLDFDTGSADLWVWSDQLSSSILSQAQSSGHTIFDTSKSSTWKESPGETWKIQYGDGSTASGDVGTDVVTIGGLTINGQAIETATQISTAFVQGAGDGLMGLAWGSINTVSPTPVQTPVENMISQDDIPKTAELFTAYLGSWRDKNDPDQGESFYTFGYIDQDVITASGQEVNYVAVDNSQGFWQFSSPNATVNGKVIDRSGNTAIADTGTTLALVADNILSEIYASIPGAKQDNTVQGWVFPSNTTADNLPVVQFAVGNKSFTVQKEDLAYADAGNGMVYGGIQSRGDLGFDILGDTFLKSVYAVFDQGNTRFGCVQRTEPSQNLTAPPAAQGGTGS